VQDGILAIDGSAHGKPLIQENVPAGSIELFFVRRDDLGVSGSVARPVALAKLSEALGLARDAPEEPAVELHIIEVLTLETPFPEASGALVFAVGASGDGFVEGTKTSVSWPSR